MPIYYVDGEFVNADQAMIPVEDLAVLRGYAVSDVMKTHEKIPYFLDEHVTRLQDSASHIGLELPWDKDFIKQIILETLEKNQMESSDETTGEATIRTLITGGKSHDFLNPAGSPRLLVLVTPQPKMPEEWYSKGIKTVTHVHERDIPLAKSTSYIPATLALKQAKAQGAVEAIYVDRFQHVLEGATSNLFAFFGNKLVTPEKGILHGITRNLVLSLAKDKFPVEKRDISLTEILNADEVFITGTNKAIVPVVQIDETTIGNGLPGNHTKTLMAKLKNHAAK